MRPVSELGYAATGEVLGGSPPSDPLPKKQPYPQQNKGFTSGALPACRLAAAGAVGTIAGASRVFPSQPE